MTGVPNDLYEALRKRCEEQQKEIEELTARIRILETYYPQWVLCQKTPELEQALEMDMTFDFDKLVVEQLPGITACNLNGVKKLELTR